MLGVAVVAVALAAPQAGVVVPAKSFAGLRLGATPAHVRAAWGVRYGVCRSCAHTTWYFNYTPFEPQGVAVEFRGRRAYSYFTLWQPPGWRTADGLRVGDPEVHASSLYARATRTSCGSYSTLRIRRAGSVTDVYVRQGVVYGFGLSRAAAPPCR